MKRERFNHGVDAHPGVDIGCLRTAGYSDLQGFCKLLVQVTGDITPMWRSLFAGRQ